MGTRVEHNFEWFEVMEVFTTVPVSQIESAMRVWNGIRDKYLLNFEEFLVSIPRGRPTRKEQQQASDLVIAQIEKKLSKSSYNENWRGMATEHWW